MKLAAKWFGQIRPSKKNNRNLPVEPVQTEARFLSIEKDVPADVIYKTWHTGKRTDDDFPALDLLTDILAGGESGRLYEKLVRKKKLFSDVNSYITGDLDPGLLVISGRLMEGVSLEKADKEILATVKELTDTVPGNEEMDKVKNRFVATYLISNMAVQHKALALCQAELTGDIAAVNTETEKYCKVTTDMLRAGIDKYITDENCTTLYYKSTSKK
jgi:predicted Zn-dependent peptidase